MSSIKILLKFSTAIIVCALLVQSCKKADVASTNTNIDKVKTYMEQVTNFSNTSGDTFHVSYANTGKVASLISASSGYQFLYSYNGALSYVLELKKGTHLDIYLLAFINSSLLVDSSFQYNDTKDSTTMKLIYNSSNQLAEQRTYSYSLSKGITLDRKDLFTYNGEGNVLTHAELRANGITNSTETYTYTNFTGNNFGYGAPYGPQLYKKLPATISIYYPGSNQTVVSNFTYAFDSSNRLIKSTMINSGGNSIVKQFEYY